MSIKNEGAAGWAVHPGEIFREDFLEPMNISAYKRSVELRVSPPTVNDIVREKRGITPEMALGSPGISVLPSSSGLIRRTPLPFIKSKRSTPRNSKRSSPSLLLRPASSGASTARESHSTRFTAHTIHDRTLKDESYIIDYK